MAALDAPESWGRRRRPQPPAALTSRHRWGLPRPGPLAGPSSGCRRPAGHGLASGREEDKAQGCCSSGVMFKIFATSMAETLANQNGPKASFCASCEFFHHWMVGCSGIPGGRSVCLGVGGEGEDSKWQAFTKRWGNISGFNIQCSRVNVDQLSNKRSQNPVPRKGLGP